MENFNPDPNVPVVVTLILSEEIVPEILLLLKENQHNGEFSYESAEDSPAGQILRFLKEISLSIEPSHEGIEDEELMKYFMIAIPNDTNIDRLLDQLRKMNGVIGAYTKGLEGPPL